MWAKLLQQFSGLKKFYCDAVHTSTEHNVLLFSTPFIDGNLAGLYEMLFTLDALQSALCDVCDSPHGDEEDEGEEEATQRHSTANERQHLQSFFILWAPLTQ